MRNFFRLTAALFLAAIPLCASYAAPQGGGVWQGEPPRDLFWSRELYYRIGHSGSDNTTFGYNTGKKQLVIAWEQLYDSGNKIYTDGGRIPTAFWPTAVAPIDDDEIVIAGKSQRGDTVIQRRRFTQAYVLEESLPGGGGETYQFFPPQQEQITEVFRENDTNYDMVTGMFPVRVGSHSNPATKIFVQFWSSRDLYELDLSTGAYSMVLSAAAQPALNGVYDAFTVREHVTQGMFYLFRRLEWVAPGEEVPILVLVDVNRDGVLDSSFTLDDTQWATGGYGDPSSWASN